MKYTVSLFPILRITRRNIEADSHEEAIKKARVDIDLVALSRDCGVAEFVEDIDGYLVEEDRDQMHEHATYYEKDGVTVANCPYNASTHRAKDAPASGAA
jgi:hypothetical protein